MGMPVSAAIAMFKHAEEKEREWQRSVTDARERFESAIVAHSRAKDSIGFARGELWEAVRASLSDDASAAEVTEAFEAAVAELAAAQKTPVS